METWQQLFEQEEQKGYLQTIRDRLEQEYTHQTIYPAKENLFRALEETPLDQVKAVILGQDPYHGPNQAMGFAFSVPKNQKIPPSLQNIYKELEDEYRQPVERTGSLADWAKQGVLLLNPILSVQAGRPMSHADLGWQQLTDEILRVLNAQPQPIVFFLWGAQARKAKCFLNNPAHLVLESAHPSPLSAYRGFFGSSQFVRANQFLESHGVPGIDWTRNNMNDPE